MDFKELFEAKDMKNQYDGFIIRNSKTKETTKYPYIKGKHHKDIEDAAKEEQAKLTKQKVSDFGVSGFVKKGKM